MVLYSRRTFPRLSSNGVRSDFHGLFSEFHSVLGALAYGQAHGAAAVRVEFRSPLYAEPDRDPNWWTYYFETAEMPLVAQKATPQDFSPAAPPVVAQDFSPAPRRSDVHLNGIVTKFGRYGGFSDIVGGPLAYLYPMAYGIDRPILNRLVTAHIRVRSDIVEEAARVVSERYHPVAFVVGVHYRRTDATPNWTGALTI